MSDCSGSAHEDRPTDREVLDALAKLGGSASAVSLLQTLVDSGYEPYKIQRTFHRMLDSGMLSIGAGLRLEARLLEAA